MHPPDRSRLTGLFLIMAAVFMFALLDASAKWLAQGYATTQIVGMRNLGGLVFALAMLWGRGGVTLPRSRRLGLQALRGLLLLGCTMSNFLALRYLPLAEANAILFTTPLFVCALSVPLLGEKVGWRRWSAILVGFAGVLIIVRPGFDTLHWAVAFSVLAALLNAFYSLATRSAAASDTAQTSLFYATLVGAAVSAPLTFLDWRTPEAVLDIMLFLMLGVIGGFGHFLLTVAHGLAPASTLAPFAYTQIVWTATLGYLVFTQLPDVGTLTGAAVVIASGLYLIHRERVLGRGITAATARTTS